MKKHILLFLFFIGTVVRVFGQTYSGCNYVSVQTLTDYSFIENTQLFDGLGRPTELIQTWASPNEDNLITFQEYDLSGRKTKTWLPFSCSDTGGMIDSAGIAVKAKTFYEDSAPYVSQVYDDSPLNRLLKTYHPGAEWHDNNKYVGVDYLSNSAVNTCKRYQLDSKGGLIRIVNNYNAGELYVIKTTDEDGNVALKFEDKAGRVILIREMSEGMPHDTYFVYDFAGRLCYVLPPMIESNISTANTDKYAYSYVYDGYRRCVQKKLPGAAAIYYVYDATDRLVLSQDGNQRLRGAWTSFKYDKFGRQVYIAEIKISDSFATLTSAFSKWKVIESFSTSVQDYPMFDTGYSRGFYHQAPTTLLTVNYYDDYRFLDMLPPTVKPNLVYQEKGYGARYQNARGQLTGTRVYEFGTPGKYTTTAFYYDDKGNVVQALSTNHLGGYEKHYYTYTFTGLVVKHLHEHSVPGQLKVSELHTNTYDHMDRLLTTSYSLNNGYTIQLCDNTYDNLGRLKMKQIQNRKEATTYSYNIRNWLTGIHGSSFDEEIDYVPFYNGNIGSIRWKTRNEANSRMYMYTYDGLNRMKTARYADCTPFACVMKNDYNVEVGSYDKQGNILQLTRHGMVTKTETPSRIVGGSPFGIIDNLKLTYTGNQLKSISDAATNDPVYKDAMHFVDGADEYEEYAYDANGNMASDHNKQIREMKYNCLNLPSEINFNWIPVMSPPGLIPPVPSMTQNTILQNYNACGTKQSIRYITNTEKILIPGGNPVLSSKLNSSVDYCENVIYENGIFSKIMIPDGFITKLGTNFVYHYYAKDHQGNIRVVLNQNKSVEEVNHYYPFGGLFGSSVFRYNK